MSEGASSHFFSSMSLCSLCLCVLSNSLVQSVPMPHLNMSITFRRTFFLQSVPLQHISTYSLSDFSVSSFSRERHSLMKTATEKDK